MDGGGLIVEGSRTAGSSDALEPVADIVFRQLEDLTGRARRQRDLAQGQRLFARSEIVPEFGDAIGEQRIRYFRLRFAPERVDAFPALAVDLSLSYGLQQRELDQRTIERILDADSGRLRRAIRVQEDVQVLGEGDRRVRVAELDRFPRERAERFRAREFGIGPVVQQEAPCEQAALPA